MKKHKIKKNKRITKKKLLSFLGIMLACIISISGILSLIGIIGSNSNLQYAKNVEPVDSRELKLDKDGLGYWTFTNEKDSNFKILQLTDIHIGNGFMCIGKDNKALQAVNKLVQNTKPDLIIVTGDMVYPVPIQSGSANNLRATKLFATLMDGFEVPWAITFGNHDEEWYSLFNIEDVAKVYEESEYCIFQKGPDEIYGTSNYFINIKNYDDSLNTSLALIDSNSYVPGLKINVYDNIHDDQVEWYENELYKITDYYGLDTLMPSLAFFHIPVNEYNDAWLKYKDDKNTDEVEWHYGKAGEAGEKVFAPQTRGKIFDKMVELGSTKGIFCGHDHLNDFSVTYNGIRLTYGKSIDYLAYYGIVPGFASSTWQRGGTVIEIDEEGEFTVEPVKLTDID